jgi:hypothetical protein
MVTNGEGDQVIKDARPSKAPRRVGRRSAVKAGIAVAGGLAMGQTYVRPSIVSAQILEKNAITPDTVVPKAKLPLPKPEPQPAPPNQLLTKPAPPNQIVTKPAPSVPKDR